MPALFGWAPGPMEIIIVGLVVLLLFGNRLPGLMRSLGRGVVEFKKGVSGVEEEKQDEEEETPTHSSTPEKSKP